MYVRGAGSLGRRTARPASTSGPQPPPRLSSPPPRARTPKVDKNTAKTRTREWAKHAMTVVTTVSGVVGEAAGDAAPGLKIGLAALKTILEKIQVMNATVDGIESLAYSIDDLSESIKRFYAGTPGQQVPDRVKRRIDELCRSWDDIAKRAEQIKGRGRVKRFFASDADAKKLEDLVAQISESVQKFLMEGVLNIEVDVDKIRRGVEAIAAQLDPLFLPMYAKNAQYDASGMRRQACLDGTRVDLLDQLCGWIAAACMNKALLHTNFLRSVWWICGLAGTGKTTIAYSIALWAKLHGLLGGSFFCSRFDAECKNPALVFITVTRQLCSFHAPFKEQVMKALEKDPHIVNSGAARQFEELIVVPLEALKELGKPFPPCLLVFDALDECLNEPSAGVGATSTIMTVVAKFIPRVEPFLTFLFTGRPEPAITRLFNKPRTRELQGATTSVVLHTIDLKLVEGDIRRCLADGFERVSEAYDVPPGWPSTEDVERLVTLANGLFIFVATAIAYIMSSTSRDPPSRLQTLATIDSSAHPSTTILDELYSEIIAASYADMSSEGIEKLQKVLGTIALAQEPLSVPDLANLLGFPEYEITNMLSGLHSVLHIPADRSDPILVLHPTFPEFVVRTPEHATSASPATGHQFYVRPARQHWYMFSCCLEAMSFLRRDMVDIRYPAKFKSDIPGFSELARKAIPPHVRYACCYWTHHLCDGLIDPPEIEIFGRLHGFIHERILFWLEACIVLGIPAAHALNAVSKACRTLGNAFADLVPILTDCRRFIQTYSSSTHTAPLQLYHFALSIAPFASGFRGIYARELEHSIVVCQGAPSHWSPSLETFVGHEGEAIYSVAFSYNGSCFASGGGDNQVIVWDSASRTELQSFNTHMGLVICVAFSPDGAHIASGSDDRTVCIWQVSSGTRVHTLKGHRGTVCSVTYSADGRRLLSATGRGVVKLWDTADGSCVFTLEKTRNWIDQAALSSSGDVIARGEGTSLVLRWVSSATHEALGLPDMVQACAFSPDGRYVAARTEHAIRVWATADKALVRSIDMPDCTLSSRLAFSHDGKYIVCGSGRGAVYVWEVTSQSSPHTLNGHTDQVRDVAWSPDGLQLASAADDGTIWLWDGALHSSFPETSAASAHQPAPPGPPRFAFIQCEGYSTLVDLPSLGIDYFPADPRLPEGAPTVMTFTDVVAACDDTLWYGDYLSSSTDWDRNWAFLTGQQRSKLVWRPVAISRDGSRLAYLSPTSRKVVDVCDLRTGIVVATLEGHTEDVHSIVFSPDGTRLATGSMDKTVKVWDATTGALICGHAEHQHWVRATAFSSDGRLVASGSDDKTMRVFDIAAERVVHVLGSHNNWVLKVMFTADDEHIVALDHSHQVVIWEVATGSRIHSFSFRTHDWPRSLTFSSDTVGIRIHSDAEERTIGVWKTNTRPITFTEFDGWVYAMLPGVTHRLCWLPSEWRTIMCSDGGTLCLEEAKSVAHPHGRVIAIDMSRIIAYIDSLPPDSQ